MVFTSPKVASVGIYIDADEALCIHTLGLKKARNPRKVMVVAGRIRTKKRMINRTR
jgi:hypothetical protein